jgi:hypothetical protein
MKYLFFLICLTKITCVFPQIGDSLLKEHLYFQVKQLDEFMQRFNYKIDVYGRKIDSTHPITRQQYLFSLFDINYLKNISQTEKSNLKAFVDEVINSTKPQFLQFANENLFAQAQCQVSYKGRENKMQLLLRVEATPNSGAKWVIADVKSDFLRLSPRKNDSSLYIPPNSHETNFMSMRQAFQQHSEQVLTYTRPDFQVDEMSIFVFEIANKNLKIKFIDKITYHFLQLEGWIFTVDFFNRADKNSGWLISRLLKSENNKARYLQNLTK